MSSASCCWCSAPLVKVGQQWWCGNPDDTCRVRQAKHAQFTTDQRGRLKEWLYVPLPTQAVWHEAVYDRSVTRLMTGGQAGPGKSRWLRETLYELAKQVPGFHALLLRKTHKDLDQSHLRFMPYEVGQRGGTWRSGDRVAVFPHRGERDAVIRAGHLEDAGAIENYLSSEYDVIAPDELVTFDRDPMLELFTRARSTNPHLLALRGDPEQELDGSLVVTASNPGGRGAMWVKEHFIDHNPDPAEFPNYKKERWSFHGARLSDNPYMAKGYREALEGLRDARRRQLLEGDWNVWEGQAFDDLRQTVNDRPYHARHLTVGAVEWSAGMDWGYHAPGWIGLFAHLPDEHYHLAVEYKFQGEAVEYVASQITALLKAHRIPRLRYIAADPAMWQKTGAGRGESIAETLLRRGLPMRKGDHDRFNGWQRLHEFLRDDGAGRPFLTISPECRYWWRTLPSLQQDEHDADDVDTDGPDHAADGTRYWAMSRPSPTRHLADRVRPSPFHAGTLLQEAIAASTDSPHLGHANVRGR